MSKDVAVSETYEQQIARINRDASLTVKAEVSAAPGWNGKERRSRARLLLDADASSKEAHIYQLKIVEALTQRNTAVLLQPPKHVGINTRKGEEMDLVQYQPLAMRTAKFMDYLDQLVHGAMGVCTEAGELAETAAKFLDSGSLNRDNVIEELGDAAWFAAYCAETIGSRLSDIAHGAASTEHKRSAIADFVAGKPVTTFEIDSIALCSAVLKLNAAGAEVGTQIKAYRFYGKVFDVVKFERALAAYMQHINTVCDVLHVSFGHVLSTNIAKLRKRYADKYSDQAAIARADKAEELPATSGQSHVHGAFDPLPAGYVNQ